VLQPGAFVLVPRGSGRRVYRGLVTAVATDTLTVRFERSPVNDSDSDSGEEGDALGDDVSIPRTAVKEILAPVGGGLGTVCINLQQTAEDGKMTLRMFGKSDDILRMLLPEMGFSPLLAKSPTWPSTSRVLVPYDAEGRRVASGGRRMWLDLRMGKKVKLTAGHNIQGAKQPQYMHIGASKPRTRGTNTKEPGEGLGHVTRRDAETTSFILNIEGAQMSLGIWWLECAMRGGVDVLPIVNQAPQFEM